MKNKLLNKIFPVLLMWTVTVLAVALSVYLYGKSFRELFILVLAAAVWVGAVVFSLVQSDIFHTLHYDNGEHYARFVLVFLTGTAACCVLPLFADAWRIMPVAALALSLFSNTVTGLAAYAGMFGICAYLSSLDMPGFLVYFLLGVVFAVLFEQLDEDYRTGKLMFSAMAVYAAAGAAEAAFQSRGFTGELMTETAVSLFLIFLLALAVLRAYCAAVIDREKGKYLIINDEAYELLAKYKEEDRQLYYNAVHTAYFAEKTAALLHMDADVAKNGGYYHRIIAAECKKRGISIEEICRENKFPPEAVRLLQEYNYKPQIMKMKETVAVYMADCVVSLAMQLDKQEKTEVNYAKLVSALIHRVTDSGILSSSEITLAELSEMEKIYTGDEEDYDILRRE